MGAGRTLGIVGESGSGKSVTSLAVMRLLDRAGRIDTGRVLFNGRDITRARHGDLQSLRGAAMSMIFQNPRAALNPIRTVEQQIVDVLRAHRRIAPAAARAQALDLLRAVLIRDPEQRLHAYPAELSGGMCQRVMIAMAIACEPSLLIADEPTTGLDVTTQQAVMDLLAGITADRGMAMILITHDLGLAARYCGEIAVMERGLMVEQGATGGAVPRAVPPLHAAADRCLADAAVHPGGFGPGRAGRRAAAGQAAARGRGAAGFAQRAEGVPRPGARGGRRVVQPAAGGSLGLVGESGSGKSTLSRLICRLIDTDGGDIIFQGESISAIPANSFHRSPQRRDIQIVFQDPNDSLNPRFTAFDCIAHPLRRLEGLRDGTVLRARVGEAASRAGLPAGSAGPLPAPAFGRAEGAGRHRPRHRAAAAAARVG